MPRIDDGSAETGPGRSLKSAWVTLSRGEAYHLLESLRVWAEEGGVDPEWHAHVSDDEGNELTIAIRPADER